MAKTLIYEQRLFAKVPIGITNGKYILTEAVNSWVDNLVIKYHYSHKATQNRFKSFVVNNDKGFLQLGYGIRPHIKETISSYITVDNYCEFDRMWLSDDLPKYSESQVISLLLSYLKQVYQKIKFVISYADSSVGNYGIIYKATSAISAGKVALDFYILPSGERIHPVSMYHRHKSRSWCLLSTLYPGIKHIKEGFQYRYLYVLNRRLKKLVLKEMQAKYQEGYAHIPNVKGRGSSGSLL
jgi:hypothetical protein